MIKLEIMDMSQLNGEGTYVLITPSNWYCYRSNSKSKFKWEQSQKTDRLDLKLSIVKFPLLLIISRIPERIY
jgi:hypothetical protein